MSKTKHAVTKHKDDAAMDEVLRRMLATPPSPITPSVKPKPKRVTQKRNASSVRLKK